MKKIVIIGATSAIAKAVARIYAKMGAELFLVARDKERLDIMCKDLKIRGAQKVHSQLLDVYNVDAHLEVVENAFQSLITVDVILIAHGTLPEQSACEKNIELLLQAMNTNAISTISLLSLFANKLELQKHGTIAAITSVAGDRGRQSNYVYGAAKGMLSIFLQGLRNRLSRSNVNVLDIKPGFVDTPMTAHFEKGSLWVKPNVVADKIIKAIHKRKNTLYVPGFWKLIMLIIRNIPEPIFKRMHL